MAIPIETGMAIINERTVVTNVPYKEDAAPNTSLTGSQSTVKRKFKIPNLCIARDDSSYRT
jgi:hypothetical protein